MLQEKMQDRFWGKESWIWVWKGSYNAFNHIDFHEENGCITFSVVKTNADYCYGSISFLVDAIVDISGCDDKDNPDEYLNVNIKLQDDTTIALKIAY